MKKSIGFFFVFILILTACGVFDPPASGTILYEDDFSSKRSGWGLMERAGGDIQLKYGGMLFSVDLPNFMFWSVTGKKYQDVQVNVDAVLVEGPVNNAFGVICRYQDEENFYGFLISHDGYYGIYKYIDGNVIMATQDGTLGYSDVIRQGGVVNHIQAVCEGNRLSLTVNDTLLTEVVDDSFAEGKVGLIAGSYEDPGVNVLFDNFQVVQP